MKWTLSKTDRLAVETLIQIQFTNMEISNIYYDFLFHTDRKLSASLIKKMQDTQKLKEEAAVFFAFLKKMNMDRRDDFIQQNARTYGLDTLQKLSLDYYQSNPYYQMIKVPSVKKGAIALKLHHYEAFEGAMFNDLRIDADDFKERNSLGYFEKRFHFPVITQNDTVWMSITPHEIETMQEAIDASKESVLVFGLGMGYYPMMCSRKTSVKSIVIIEKDPIIIDVFKTYLLPQFPHPEKITIIEEDAYAYIEKSNELSTFSTVFIDLWHDAEDGIEHYLRMKAIEHKFHNARPFYWIEETLLSYLRRCLAIYMQESLDPTNKNNYNEASTISDQIINHLHQILQSVHINSYAKAHHLFTKRSLTDLAKQISLSK